ncbi:MAG: hypothetical protein JWP69_53 [Flaviaesturariibacter sp.]|nr:hypothetical protein [Flaviaesturariibacter sp.]
MKKTILALTLVGCGAVAGAQDSLKTNASMQNSQNSSMQNSQNASMQNSQNTMDPQMQSSVGSYNAYGTAVTVPSHTQAYLLRDYPTATNATWQQSGDWYRANVINNNRSMHMYYGPSGDSYAVALPVTQSWVPEEVITSALNTYGTSIYAVNRIKGATGQELYAVTVLENGVSRTEYLNLDGTSVAALDVFRTDNMQMDPATGTWNNTSSNAAMGNTNSSTNTTNGTGTNNSNLNTTNMNGTTNNMGTTNMNTNTNTQTGNTNGTGTKKTTNTKSGTTTKPAGTTTNGGGTNQ